MQVTMNTFAARRMGMRAIAAVLSMGCIAAPGFALAENVKAAVGDQAQPNKKLLKQLGAAERAVAKQPQSLEARNRLAQTYLAAGRFASAATTFEDAVSLGDKTPSTALAMALSYIGAGRNAEGRALLGQWRDAIPASDYALAVALAGAPDEAIAVLSAAIKQGENTPKIRQNLAYAFALSGQLSEARVIAAQDLPADQLEVRLSDWALQASVGSQRSRVAALLGAPMSRDPGQPAALALAPVSDGPALAASAAPLPPAPAAQELPPLAADAPVPVFAQAEPQPAAEPTSEPVATEASTGVQFVSNPVVQDLPAAAAPRMAKIERFVPVPRSAAPKASSVTASAPAKGNHVVQLGSFTTEEGAQRAWGIFVRRDPSLKGRELRITQAMVNGRRYFRVAAAGYDAASARAKCFSVRGRGSECLAYGAGRPLPGAVAAIKERLARR